MNLVPVQFYTELRPIQFYTGLRIFETLVKPVFWFIRGETPAYYFYLNVSLWSRMYPTRLDTFIIKYIIKLAVKEILALKNKYYEKREKSLI